MWRTCLIGLLASLALAPSASAFTVVTDSGIPLAQSKAPFQRQLATWAKQSHLKLPPMGPITVDFADPFNMRSQSGGSDVTAYADSQHNAIHVLDSNAMFRHDFYHEVGHLYDAKYLTDAKRKQLQDAGLVSAGTWDPPTDDPMVQRPIEQFAELFAYAMQHKTIKHAVQGVAYWTPLMGPKRLQWFRSVLQVRT